MLPHSSFVIRHSSFRPAFTLIELLVVISIIGILSALLLPALSRAKLKTKQIQCLSNIKQLSLASFTYASDQQKHAGYDTTLSGGTWRGVLLPLLQEQKICVCPSAPLPPKVPSRGQVQGYVDRAWIRWINKKTMLYASYGYNGWLYSDLVSKGQENMIQNFALNPAFYFTSEATLQKPSLTPVFVDANWIDLWPMEIDKPSSDLYTGSPFWVRTDTIGRCTLARHKNGNPGKAPRRIAPNQKMPGAINLGCADGHAELAPLERLWDYYWHYDWRPTDVPRR